MKKLLFLSFAVLIALMASANPVDPDRAVQVAKNYLAQYVKGADQYPATVVYTHSMPKSGQPAMYVVNVGNMFVLVAADDVAHPVLGYSLSRPWPVQNEELKIKNEESADAGIKLPSQVTGYLDDLARQIAAAVQAGIAPDKETAAEWQLLLTTTHIPVTTNPPDSIGPLLTTTWDQGQYYNAMCPEDANGDAGHAVTGCVATAMAQIINYWGYPIHGRGTHSYNSNYGTLTVNYDSANYDYANMPVALTATSTTAQINTVATLMRDCGVAVNMGYSAGESSAYDQEARAALINFFRFSPNLSYAEKMYFTNTEWSNLLRENIGANEPVYYSGHGTGGHAFVCDGYKTDDYFHFNFGWGSYADGWYLTSAVNPAGMEFNSNQSIIVGIVPDSTGNVILGQMNGTSTFMVDGTTKFYHLLGHNVFTGTNYNNSFESTTFFIASDTTVPIVTNLISFGGSQSARVYYGLGDDYYMVYPTMTWFPRIESVDGTFTIHYYGNLHYDGFCLLIAPKDTCSSMRFFDIAYNTDTNQINLLWTDNDNSEWEVEYGTAGFTLGNGTSMIIDTTFASIGNLIPLTLYDVYIKSTCASNWIGPISIRTNMSYWQDYVVNQPEGIIIDENGYALVSTPEQLSWVMRDYSTYKKIRLMADIDLGGHRWKPVDYSAIKEIDGGGHSITNMFINEDEASNKNYIGFIGSIYRTSGKITDLTFVNPNVNSSHSEGSCGVLAGNIIAEDSIFLILNCGVDGGEIACSFIFTGGLIGDFYGDILNCYANARIENLNVNPHTGGLIGNVRGGSVINCYTASEIVNTPYVCSEGQIIGSVDRGVIRNVYGKNSAYPLLPQVLSGDVYNVVSFEENQILNTGINFDDSIYYELCDVLNKYVALCNDSTLRCWHNDSTSNYPVFGNLYHVNCSNATNVEAKNVINNGEYALRLDWDSNMAASYVVKFINITDSLDSIRIYNTDTHPIFIEGLHIGDRYEIYVKCSCDSSQSGWGNPLTHIVDIPYWTDIVTSRPSGYEEDENGNVYISSAEGLSWFASCVDGLNGNVPEKFRNKRIVLNTDIDLGQYRWIPIGNGQSAFFNQTKEFQGIFDGRGHTIRNVYINEDVDYVGFFGRLFQAKVINVTIKDSYIKGRIHVGGLCGIYNNSDGWWNEFNYGKVSFDNCHVENTTVYGINRVGGLLGLYQPDVDSSIIRNCSSSGIVEGGSEYGGLIGFVAQQSNKHVGNCFSISKVTYNNGNGLDNGYYGGLIGYAYNTRINNCFFAGFLDSLAGCWSGLIIGVLDNSHANCLYGLSNNIYGPFSVYGVNTVQNTTLFTELEEQQILQNPVTINDATYNNLLSALNAWVDANDTAGIYRHWAADLANVNGGFPVFAAIPCPPAIGSDSITVCDSYTWHGTTYTTSTELIDTLSTNMGCDSIVTHHLTIHYPTYTAVTREACETYTWTDGNGETYTASANPTYPHPDAHNCTQVDTLHLTIYYPTHTAVTREACETYTWTDGNGETYTASANPTYPHSDAHNCTQVDTLHLTIHYPTHTSVTREACETYTWADGNGETYTASANPTYPHPDAHNCTQVDTLHLTIHYPTHTAVTREACETYTWTDGNGETYTASANPIYPHHDVHNCTQVDTLHLTIKHNSFGVETVTACNSFIWYNTEYTESNNTDTHLLPNGNAEGCDSTVTLNLTIRHCSTTTLEACESYTWVAGTGETYYESGEYHFGTDTLMLTIHHPVHHSVTREACETYTWTDGDGETYTASANPTYPHPDANNCTQVDTLHLTINHNTFGVETVTACDSYTWHGTTYTASNSTATFTGTNAAGCDSVVTLHLTINYSNTGVETVTACDSYTWHGTTYTASNSTSTFTGTNAAGCDSVVTLNLTINYSNTGVETVAACDSYTWHGTTYTASNSTATFTGTNAAGCDSVVTLNLTINTPVHTATSETACETYTWDEGDGVSHTATGTYTYSHPDNNGCTQVDTLHLTVNYPVHTVITETACDSYTWHDTEYTASGDYTYTTTGSNGCDSTTTLTLVVNHSVTTYDTLVLSESDLPLDYSGTTITEGGNYDIAETTVAGCDSTVRLHVEVNTTGIGDMVYEEVTLYPNPTTGVVTISADNVAKVEVMDMVGRRMAVFTGTNTIDISHLAEGSYIVRVTLSDSTAVRKVVKR